MEFLNEEEFNNTPESSRFFTTEVPVEKITAFDLETGSFLYIEAAYGRGVFVEMDLEDGGFLSEPISFSYKMENFDPRENDPVEDISSNPLFVSEAYPNANYIFNPDGNAIYKYFEKKGKEKGLQDPYQHASDKEEMARMETVGLMSEVYVKTTEDEIKLLNGEARPVYGSLGRGGWSLHYDNETKTVTSGYDCDAKLELFKMLDIPFYDSRSVFEEDITKSVSFPMIAVGREPDSQDKLQDPFYGSFSYDSLENVFRRYANIGADIYSIDIDGITYDRDIRKKEILYSEFILEAAEKKNWKEVLSLVIEEGYADVNTKDSKNRNILHLAVFDGADDNVIKALVDAGADVNAKDDAGWTPLHAATYMLDNTTIGLLLEHGADISETKGLALTAMFKEQEGVDNAKKTEVLKTLIECGAETDYISGSYETALMVAAKQNNMEAVKILVDAGATISYQNPYTESAYKNALAHGSSTEMIQFLDKKLSGETYHFMYETDDSNRYEITEAIENRDLQLHGHGAGVQDNPNYALDDYRPVLKSGLKIKDTELIGLSTKGMEIIAELKKGAEVNPERLKSKELSVSIEGEEKEIKEKKKKEKKRNL